MRAQKKKHRNVGFEVLESRQLMSATLTVGAGQQYTTLQAAANAVKAGDTVIVEAGNYAGFQLIGKVSGTASAPITFDFQAGAKITSADSSTGDGIDLENCDFVTIEGATITNNGSIDRAGIRLAECDGAQLLNNNVNGMGEWGLYTSHSSDTIIEGNTCANSIGQHGIYVANSSSNVKILDNTIFGNANCGIHINGDDSQGDSGIMTNITVAGNIIYDNGATGGSSINCDGVQNSLFENNLIYGNKNKGICLFKGDSAGASLNDTVVNNTIIESGSTPALEIVDGSTGATVFNNIFLGNEDIDSASQSGLKQSNNVTSGSASSLFVNASAGNYQLAANSAAQDAGVASFNGKTAASTDAGANPLTTTATTGSSSSSNSGSSSSDSGSSSSSSSSGSSSSSSDSGSSSTGSSSSTGTSDSSGSTSTTETGSTGTKKGSGQTAAPTPVTTPSTPTDTPSTGDSGDSDSGSTEQTKWVGHWLARHRHHCHHRHTTAVAA